MNPFEMTVVIVLIITVGRVLRARFGDTSGRSARTMRIRMGGPDDGSEAENSRLQSEIARLNERIRVLERLATDPARRLSDEIESLKDK